VTGSRCCCAQRAEELSHHLRDRFAAFLGLTFRALYQSIVKPKCQFCIHDVYAYNRCTSLSSRHHANFAFFAIFCRNSDEDREQKPFGNSARGISTSPTSNRWNFSGDFFQPSELPQCAGPPCAPIAIPPDAARRHLRSSATRRQAAADAHVATP